MDSDVLLLEIVLQVRSYCFPLIIEGREKDTEDHMHRNREAVSALMVNFSFEDKNLSYLLLHQKVATVEITPPEQYLLESHLRAF